jgi:hypothetical protein
MGTQDTFRGSKKLHEEQKKTSKDLKRIGWFYRRGLNSYFYYSVTRNDFDQIAGVDYCALKSLIFNMLLLRSEPRQPVVEEESYLFVYS